MNHVFTVWHNGKLITVNNYELIPDNFDFVVEFRPFVPPPPHTEVEHNEIALWEKKFHQLIKKEKSCRH
jgi:hypothetical protein